MIVAWLDLASASVPRCKPPPDGIVSRWPLEQDGRDLRGSRSAAPSDGVMWPSFWASNSLSRRLETSVFVPGTERLVITDLALPSEWTLEGWFSLETSAVQTRLLQIGGRETPSIWLDYDPLADTLVFSDPSGAVSSWPAGDASRSRRFGLAVSSDGSVTLLADQLRHPTDATFQRSEPHYTLQIGGSSHEEASLSVRDLTLHSDASLTLPELPWCLPAARTAIPLVQKPQGDLRLTMDGYFLGWMGRIDEDRWIARQRLVLSPIVHLSPVTRVAVAARTLEPRTLHRSGSTLRPLESGATARGEFGLTVEHAFLARYVGEWRILPFYFVAGRVPLTFGLGLGDRNSVAALGPPPRSTVALLDSVQAGTTSTRNPDSMGIASFGSTLDGAMLFLGSPPSRTPTGKLRTAFGARWGRRNPWCASREGIPPACDGDQTAAVYEVAGTAVVQRQVRPGTEEDAAVLQVEGGTRWSEALAPIWFLRGAGSYTTARRSWVWLDLSGETLAEQGLAEDQNTNEQQGSLFAAVLRAEVALRSAPVALFSIDGGLTGGLGEGPIRGLHPDYNLDLVMFSQVLSDAVATANLPSETGGVATTRLLPTLGGVSNAGFVRYSPTIRIGARSGFEIPLQLVHAWTLLPVAGLMGKGYLGTEGATGLHVNSESWRLAAEVGALLPGRGLAPALALTRMQGDRFVVSWELRVGRNL